MRDSEKETFVLKIVISDIQKGSEVSKDLIAKVNKLVETILNESLSGSKVDYKLSFCDSDNNPN